MAKQIIICDCDECPKWLYVGGIKTCKLTGSSIEGYYRKIPSNCPLDDVNITFTKVA